MHGRVVVAGKPVAGAGPLDLDHARAQIAQVAGAKWTGHGLLEGHHRNAAQGKCRIRHQDISGQMIASP